MARFDSQGNLVSTSIAEYIRELEVRFRAVLGEDLNLAADTAQGQLIGILAFTFAQEDQVLVAQSNALSLSHAAGRQLDDLASVLGIARLEATRSTVTATFTGTQGTISAGSRAATPAGVIFETVGTVEIPASGTMMGEMRAVGYGPVAVAPGELNTVLSPSEVWTGVTNAAAAVLGRDEETDLAFRRRLRLQVGVNALGTLDAIQAAALSVSGVGKVRVYENATAAAAEASAANTAGTSVAANSVLVVIDAGVEADVTTAVRNVMPPGVAVAVDTARAIPITVTLATTTEEGFHGAVDVSRIRNALYEHVQALRIGEGVTPFTMQSAAVAVPNHTVTAITLARKTPPGGVGVGDILATDVLTLLSGDITVSLS